MLSGKRLALALNDPNIDKEEVFDAFNFMMLYTSTQATVQGQVDAMNTIIDLGGVAVWELPTADIIRMLNIM